MTPAPRPVGVMGGTFDPVHHGHIHVAERVGEAFGLARVVLVPSGAPPHKRGARITAAHHRLAMVRLATHDRPWIAIDDREIDRDGPSFTIDTLDELRRESPGIAPVFIVGMDMLFEIDTWRDWTRLLAEFDLIAVDRPGGDLDAERTGLTPDVARRVVPAGDVDDSLGAGGRVFHLPIPPMDVSSREIRRRAADGEDFDALVPPGVALYIRDHRLYRKEDRS